LSVAIDANLRTREDMQRALLALCSPVESLTSPGGARVSLGSSSAHYSPACREMEGYCRLLWGVAPLLAGGAEYPGKERLQRGLLSGTDPAHPEFWGCPADRDQRFVELAAIAFAMLVAPAAFWEPFSRREKTQIGDYLRLINKYELRDNNWLFFRVLVNLALQRMSEPFCPAQLEKDLSRLEEFYLGDGWYKDGPAGQSDYYVSFAMHFYALVYAHHARDTDGRRASRFLERAALFASQFICWFSPDGSAIPYGRSLTYRFAQGAFWGALAVVGVQPEPGVTRGLLFRHLRWWLQRPIFSETGLLTIGYAYSNPSVAEDYTSPSSPYWALKAFWPLCLPADHAFWRSSEQDLPPMPEPVAQVHPGMLVCRDEEHVFALTGGKTPLAQHRHSSEKYAKFCYSTHFGFSIPAAQRWLHSGAHDSMLALSTDGEYFRVRTGSSDVELMDSAIRAQWSPWPDVAITTWLIAILPWHVRVHLIRTSLSLIAAEGGFALSLEDEERTSVETPDLPRNGVAAARTAAGLSAVCNLYGKRTSGLVRADSNTNILYPRSLIPTLTGDLEPGVHWLACAVWATNNRRKHTGIFDAMPSFQLTADGFQVLDGLANRVFTNGRTL
jgi:hypothetical protein